MQGTNMPGCVKTKPPKPSKDANSSGGNRKVELNHNTPRKNVLSRVLLSKAKVKEL